MPTSTHKPRIGISANHKDDLSCIADTYVNSVVKAGGAPVLIPVITDEEALTEIIDSLDGLILSGGGDINPLFLHEEPIPQLQDVDSVRDQYDLLILRLATDRQLPVMGICRGHQLINVFCGGTIYQDINSQKPGVLKHSQSMPRTQASHSVKITDGTKLSKILDGAETLQVNSFHHQAVKDVAPEFVSSAVAPDGINEGIEHPERDIFSVQWHPEGFASVDDEQALKLFRYEVENARVFRQAKELHHRIITLDSHTDTPYVFPDNLNIGVKAGGKVNLPLMSEGRIDATYMAAYIAQGKRDDESLQAAYDYAMARLVAVRNQEKLYPERMGIATTADDLIRLKKEGKKAILMGIENGYAIGKNLKNVETFAKMGVTYITLCHNGNNDICDSAADGPEWNGLSPFGKEVVHEMNRFGIMVDISHTAESTFWDAIETSNVPIVASHSAARALCDHPRNLTDEQLKALAQKNGVVQLCLYKGFINSDAEKASLSDAIRHICHIAELIGTDYIGIGSDFDGDGELIGCRASNELINITTSLLKEGFSEADIRKIWGGNWMRVMNDVQSAANK